MADWFAGLGGREFATAILWTIAALVLLAIIVIVLRLIRNMNAGTFVAGGRNRKTRLAVMDAAAVDSHRRLVLVRRDDIEHLLLIGGPTDVVVEREIRVTSGRRTSSVFSSEDDTAQEMQTPAPHPAQTLPRQRAPQAPQPPAHPQPLPQSNRASAPIPAPAPARQPQERWTQPPQPARQPTARPPARETQPPTRIQAQAMPARLPPVSPPDRSSQAAQRARSFNDDHSTNSHSPSAALDDALLQELEVTFDAEMPKNSPPPRPVEMTVDDEMSKLLGELSNKR